MFQLYKAYMEVEGIFWHSFQGYSGHLSNQLWRLFLNVGLNEEDTVIKLCSKIQFSNFYYELSSSILK